VFDDDASAWHVQKFIGIAAEDVDIYPLVNIQKAIENGHGNSGFTYKKW